MPFKMHKIIIFPEKKRKRLCVPTLPKIFGTVTRYALIIFICPQLYATGVMYIIAIKEDLTLSFVSVT